jgi:catechol 2,3-dioxygenase-like lactoylglutathione lyase family enzyme
LIWENEKERAVKMTFYITDYALLVDDLQKEIDFYHGKLGLEIKRLDTGFAEFHTGDTTLCLWEAQDVRNHVGKEAVSEKGHWFMGAFEFESGHAVKEAYDELKSKGVDFITELKFWDWGATAAYFKDPEGYLWEIFAWTGTPYTW